MAEDATTDASEDVRRIDDETRKYFAEIMSAVHGVAADARASAASSYEALQVSRRVESRVAVVEGNVLVLQKHVFGSDPPPAPPMRPIAESIGDHDGEIATLSGQVIAARAEIAEVKIQNEQQLKQNEEQLKISRNIASAIGNPWVRRVAWAIGSIIVMYATSKGLISK